MNTISIYSTNWDRADSYGRKASELRDHLTRLGVHVNTLGASITTGEKPVVKTTFGGILMGYPTIHRLYGVFANLGTRIAVTAWESDQLPLGWLSALNQCKAVSVGSRYVKEVFERGGVQVPVYVHPLGISEAFTYRPRPPRKPFTFLAFADRWDRKGTHEAVQAFVKAFGDDENYRLILKMRADKPETRMALANPNIERIRADMTERELNELYHRCDAMIFPTSAEGFGIPPREFAATGGLALATNYAGTADDLPQWGIPIDHYDLVPAWQMDKRFSGTGQWAQVDTHHLAKQLQWVAAMPLTLRNVMGQQFANNARRLYSWSAFADNIYRLWSSLNEERANAANSSPTPVRS